MSEGLLSKCSRAVRVITAENGILENTVCTTKIKTYQTVAAVKQWATRQPLQIGHQGSSHFTGKDGYETKTQLNG